MAALMLQVPAETARVLHEIPVPGTKDQGDPHITVMYLGKDVPIERISSMLPVIYDVTSRTLPFSVATSHISNFPPNDDDGVPVIAKINSPALHRFRDALCAAFDEAELPYDKKFPEYKPHTTLAYSPDPETTVDQDIPEISWGAHELVLWGSDRGTGRLVVKFPLSLPMAKVATRGVFPYRPPNEALYRAAVKLAVWGQRDRFV
jgi:2'-5' RNA ligase